jgi:type IV pilus assembly protein PilY1
MPELLVNESESLVMNRKALVSIAALLLAGLLSPAIRAQTPVTEDFTGASTINSWYFFNGACLTASTAAASGNPGSPPGCTALQHYVAGGTTYGSASAASAYYNEYLVGGVNGTGAYSQQLPDAVNSGALRLTNGSSLVSGSYVGGFAQNGAIISAVPYATANGLQITFKTITYRGNSGGNGGVGNSTVAGPGNGLPINANDGADGMNFFLLNSSATPNIGSWGGSLGYTCSNANPTYDGMVGAYLGLGIDEYGNYLNPGDNTVSGPGLQANRIGLRGAGSISWAYLSATYPSDYPAALSTMAVTLPNGATGTAAEYAVYDTCRTGMVWNYSTVTSPAKLSSKTETSTAVAAGDYPAVPNGYTVLSGVQIADEYANGGYARTTSGVTPIYYRLKISPSGLLSLQYSINGGAYTYVLQNESLTPSSGTLPTSLYYGFAGSTGGSSNIHEILCFQIAPSSESSSSTTVNEKQSAQLNETTQAFFAYYNPNNWTGRLTANALTMASGSLTVATTPTWDASCVLTGESAARCLTGVATTAEAPTSRVILSWNGTTGIPFEWANLTTAQQAALDLGDATTTSCYPDCRLNFLRGDRTQEVNSAGVGLFRARTNVLADIVDSSPTWVGPPSAPYTHTWLDRLYPAAAMPENTSGASSYPNFVSTEQGRLNVVYVGANDGLLHGFEAGSLDVDGNLINNSSTPNDGKEVLAYMPGSVLQSAASSTTSTNCTGTNATQSVVQNIHGVTPAIGSAGACSQPAIDYSNTQYGHNFFVDGTPGTGDLYYGGAWHSWLVGGLGAGGAAVYALDVTNPSNFAETGTAPQKLVMGEWTSASGSINCVGTAAGNANCYKSLGNSYGTPLIRRLHNGQWGLIFGNGIGSSTGDAGIFVGVIGTSGTVPSVTFYYLSTGQSGDNDGIAYVAAADLDGDNITDYVYAGDLLGNVWRFDLTSNLANSWAVLPKPLFKTNTGQPITTQLVIAAGTAAQTVPQVMVAFGTGQKIPLSNTSAVSYATAAPQDLYGFWDWNMSEWNGLSTAQYASLTAAQVQTCVGSTTLTKSNLQAQTIVVNSNGDRDIATNASILWPSPSSCIANTSTSQGSTFGWDLALPGTQEQIIYNPSASGTAFQVNSIVPAQTSLLSCTIPVDTGFTYAVSLLNGGAIPGYFPNYTSDTSGNPAGIGTNATGTSSVVNSSESTGSGTSTWLVYQTTSGTPKTTQISPQNNITGNRLTWKQLR